MSNYVLIIFLIGNAGGGVDITVIDFQSKTLCETAQERIVEARPFTQTVCVRRKEAFQ